MKALKTTHEVSEQTVLFWVFMWQRKKFLQTDAADVWHSSFVIVGRYFNQVSYLMSNKTKR